jgi:hypothetical protein
MLVLSLWKGTEKEMSPPEIIRRTNTQIYTLEYPNIDPRIKPRSLPYCLLLPPRRLELWVARSNPARGPFLTSPLALRGEICPLGEMFTTRGEHSTV